MYFRFFEGTLLFVGLLLLIEFLLLVGFLLFVVFLLLIGFLLFLDVDELFDLLLFLDVDELFDFLILLGDIFQGSIGLVGVNLSVLNGEPTGVL